MEAAVYCLKGHYVGLLNEVIRGRSWHQITILLENPPERQQLPPFCTKCGAVNISTCQHCQLTIEKQYPGVIPAYCGGCGKPFPWTEAALSEAREYTDDLELTPGEKTELKNTFPDLTVETVRTPLAVSRFKAYTNKIGPVGSATLKKILDVAIDEGVKKLLGLM
jgi:hypothetical protein